MNFMRRTARLTEFHFVQTKRNSGLKLIVWSDEEVSKDRLPFDAASYHTALLASIRQHQIIFKLNVYSQCARYAGWNRKTKAVWWSHCCNHFMYVLLTSIRKCRKRKHFSWFVVVAVRFWVLPKYALLCVWQMPSELHAFSYVNECWIFYGTFCFSTSFFLLFATSAGVIWLVKWQCFSSFWVQCVCPRYICVCFIHSICSMCDCGEGTMPNIHTTGTQSSTKKSTAPLSDVHRIINVPCASGPSAI